MKIDLTNYAPMGIPAGRDLRLLLLLPLAFLLRSSGFLFAYGDAKSDLYFYTSPGTAGVLDPTAKILPFAELIRGTFDLLPFFLVLCLGCAIYYYSYHYQGGRSIYLMRRLPNPWELHRRCLTFPVLTAVLLLFLRLILPQLFHWVYLTFTPVSAL